MQATRLGMPLAEYMRRYDAEGPFEIIDGAIVPMSPTKFGHSYLTRLLFLTLHNFVSSGNEWEVFSETPFIKSGADDPNWVEGSLVPDVMLLRTDRLTAYKASNADWRERPLAVVPDLAIEIVSPGDRYSDVNRKVERYFERGTRLVWLFDPQRKKVTVHQAGSNQQVTLGMDQILTGGDVLPGFSIDLKTLFE